MKKDTAKISNHKSCAPDRLFNVYMQKDYIVDALLGAPLFDTYKESCVILDAAFVMVKYRNDRIS